MGIIVLAPGQYAELEGTNKVTDAAVDFQFEAFIVSLTAKDAS